MLSSQISSGFIVGSGLKVSLRVEFDGASDGTNEKVSLSGVGAGEIEKEGLGDIVSLDVGNVVFNGVGDGDCEPRRLVGLEEAVGVIVGTELPLKLGVAVTFIDGGISSENNRIVELGLDSL